MSFIPHTLTGLANGLVSDAQCTYRFACARVAPESTRVWLGGQTDAQQQAAAKQAQLYSGMAKTAVVVGVVALAVLLGAATAVGAGVLVSNGIGGSLLTAYGQGITAQQLITYGSIGAGGAFVFKLGALIAEKTLLGMKERTVQNTINRNWTWAPECMKDYVK